MCDRQASLVLAIEQLSIEATARQDGYWGAKLQLRRLGDSWSKSEPEVYEGLTRSELLDVVGAWMADKFHVADPNQLRILEEPHWRVRMPEPF